jgi:hypothetical protein
MELVGIIIIIIVTGYGLDDRGFPPDTIRIFSLLQRLCSPAFMSHTLGTVICLAGMQWPAGETEWTYSHPYID